MGLNFQDIVKDHLVARRSEALKGSPQLLLGELILKLEAIGKGTLPVYYDFGDKHPTNLDSWRGSYDELALNYDSEGEPLTVDGLLVELKGAIGKTYMGYKGGEFVMGRGTPVWVDNYGEAGSVGIVDIQKNEGEAVVVVLITAECEF